MDLLSVYFYKKHIVSLRDYPHFLISGQSGSGKSYLALDPKRSYGLYRDFADYSYELDDIVSKLKSVESEMSSRMKQLQPELDKNPNVLARQSNIHILMVMQAAGTENINATTRSNLTKILLGNAQSNILTATFGTGAD